MTKENETRDPAVPLDRRALLGLLGAGGAGALLASHAALAADGAEGAAATEPYDLVIRGGRVVDGSGAPGFEADVAISGGRFVEVGAVGRRGKQEIDARGLVVSPGWIDTMDQSGRAVRNRGSGGSKVRMGLTTLIAGEMGTPVPADQVSAYLADLDANGMAVNFGTYYSASQARRAVAGSSAARPSKAQIAEMADLVDEAMRAGALGMSTALIYPPASFMTTEELIELARPVGRYKGTYATHMRDEGEFVLEAIDEAIGIGQAAGTDVHIYHLKAAFAPGWGKLIGEMGRKIDRARAGGLNVFADMYPYEAAGTGLRTTVPNWMFKDGMAHAKEQLRDPAIRARLKAEVAKGNQKDWTNFVYNAGGWDRVVLGVPFSEEYDRFRGMKITDIAAALGKDPADAAWDIVLAEKQRASAFYFMMSEKDIETALKFPWIGIGSDAGVRYGPGSDKGYPHPRSYGCFPRIIAEYVRRRKVLTLEQAIAKMTSVPAANLRLAGRGLIKPGNWADVTIFDYARIDDVATFENPIQLPVGIEHVIVNGTPTMLARKRTPARPGKVLRGPGARAA
ncbi:MULTISPECIES: N-acyl-D-amino-acid deacylase family protein [Sphingopyxis]|uniref:N-acyl-D-amino-acid deacylase family protein n=1 Tax=Sphingopyxis TaxID=165697 RepID=UPI0009F9F762|nr:MULTISPECIES: D-aminoacylase [Sphingopyxis]AVA15720.1 D-aminoacylase [Sphingopyxis sp. MG]